MKLKFILGASICESRSLLHTGRFSILCWKEVRAAVAGTARKDIFWIDPIVFFSVAFSSLLNCLCYVLRRVDGWNPNAFHCHQHTEADWYPVLLGFGRQNIIKYHNSLYNTVHFGNFKTNVYFNNTNSSLDKLCTKGSWGLFFYSFQQYVTVHFNSEQQYIWFFFLAMTLQTFLMPPAPDGDNNTWFWQNISFNSVILALQVTYIRWKGTFKQSKCQMKRL